jgi:hypothetical protein
MRLKLISKRLPTMQRAARKTTTLKAAKRLMDMTILEVEMTNAEFDFETWFDSLVAMVMDKSGFAFRDEESVRADYDAGRNCADVADEIADEYRDMD